MLLWKHVPAKDATDTYVTSSHNSEKEGCFPTCTTTTTWINALLWRRWSVIPHVCVSPWTAGTCGSSSLALELTCPTARTPTHTHTFSCHLLLHALLNTPVTLQSTCMPPSTTAFQSKTPSMCSKITRHSCPMVVSAPWAPTHRLVCRNHTQGGLVCISPSTSVVLESLVKLVNQCLREKHIFSAYFYAFMVSNEVAHAIDLHKKALYIHPSIFFLIRIRCILP